MIFELHAAETPGRPARHVITFTTSALVTDEDYAKVGMRIAELLRGVSAGKVLDQAFGGWDEPVTFKVDPSARPVR